jgi:hypothetical protein
MRYWAATQVPRGLLPFGIVIDSIIKLAPIVLVAQDLTQDRIDRIRIAPTPDDLPEAIVGNASKKQGVVVRLDEWIKPTFEGVKHLLFIVRRQWMLDAIDVADENGEMPGEQGLELECLKRDVDRGESRQIVADETPSANVSPRG